MNARRLLTAVSAGLVGATAFIVGTPTAASAALPAPKNLSVTRTAADVHKIRVAWNAPASDVHHYVVDIVAGDVQTVVDVPASTTSYTVDAPDNCTSYKIRVGAADAAGTTTNTGYWSLKSLAPGYVMGLAPGREDGGTVATATWRPPSWTGYTPLTGYRTVFTRLSDSAVLVDRTSTDLSFRYPDVDPGRAYTLAVSTVNEYGACLPAKSLLDRYRPADPTSLVVQRRADAPGTVEVVWQPATTGPAPTSYLIGYGQTKVTNSVRVDAPTTSHTLPLDVSKSWVVEVKSYNDNGGSNAATGTVPVWAGAPAGPAPTATPSATPSEAPTATPTDAPSATPTTAAPSPTASDDAVSSSSTTTTTVGAGSDLTPPTITATLSQKATNGWFRSPTTIHFVCDDDSGAVAVCPADVVADTDGLAQRYSGTAVDKAGNTTTRTLTLRIDQTPPTITAAVTGTKNAEGWYTSAPVIRYTCSDATSTIYTCPPDTPVTAEGANQHITGTVMDKAGNTASAPVVINLDRVAPAITATVIGDVNADGWYTGTTTVRFVCTDTGSGIASCPADRTVTTDGTAQTVTGAAIDKAGNTAGAMVKLNVDRTAPAITAEVIGDVSEDGWYRGAPVVRFTCTDEVSGVATCPADVTVDGDGAGQEVTGTATDKAGNTATTAVTVNVDRTAPAITATVLGDANADGWYRNAPVVRFECSDELAGIAVCPEDTTISTEGAGQEVTGTAVDKAGNTATAKVTVSVDRTAPEITAALSGDMSATGWYTGAPTVRFTCTDAGAGVASCPADQPVPAGTTEVSGIAYDLAGHTASTTVPVNVDRTAPVVTVTGVTADAVYTPGNEPEVACRTTDAESGVAAEATPTRTAQRGKHTVVCAGAEDRAGNKAAPVSVSWTVEVDVHWLIALTDRYLEDGNGANRKDLEVALLKGRFGTYITKVALLTLNRKSGMSTREATTLIYWALYLDLRS
jgi:hypothetical protein